jgi:hypothetical protein
MQGPYNHAYRPVGGPLIDFADAGEASGRRLCSAPPDSATDNVDLPSVRHHDAPMPLLVNDCAVLLSAAAGSGKSRTALAPVQKRSQTELARLFCHQFLRQFLERLELNFQARRTPDGERDPGGKPLNSLATHLLGDCHRKKGPLGPGRERSAVMRARVRVPGDRVPGWYACRRQPPN